MEPGQASSGKKVPRKTVEKQRRILMKTLCFKMASVIPDHHFPLPKELTSQQDLLVLAASYIEILRERVEELRKRKTQVTQLLMMNPSQNNAAVESKKQPTLTVQELGSVVEVVVISWVRRIFRLRDVITIIQQEAAEVLTVSVSNLDDKMIHTIHAQVRFSRIGVDTARMSERIHELISST